MLSFAIPGTVIGISYILAFNVPPLELTGTGVILVICFVFRNMPVGVRAGVAAMSQLDQSLDEASLTLGANTFTTVRRVILPLLRPAIVAALVFSFVRAMTAISAVIFLVSAELRHGDLLHHRPGRERRLRPCDLLRFGADPGHAGRRLRWCSWWSASGACAGPTAAPRRGDRAAGGHRA